MSETRLGCGLPRLDGAFAGLRLSRREALMGGGAMAGLLLAGGVNAATLGAPDAQSPGVFRFALGAARITIVSDGHLEIPATGVGVNVDPEEVRAFLTANFLDPVTRYSHTNVTLIELGEAKVLVDLGSGAGFQPTAGKLMANLEAAAIDPASITHVVMTHAHPDHIWGLLDDFDELQIPQAQYAIGATEFDWWMKEGRVDESPESMQVFVVGARNRLTPIAEQTRMLKDGDAIAPGITAMETLGHTMGHLSIRVESEEQSLIVLGDAVAGSIVHFEKPDWHGGFDTDGPMAAETRKKLLDQAATDRIAVVGYHFPFPGVGHVARAGAVYRYIPAVWRWAG